MTQQVRTPVDNRAQIEAALGAQAEGSALPFATAGERVGPRDWQRTHAAGDWLDLDGAALAAHGGEYGSEVPDAAACVRGAGRDAAGTEDGFAERAIAAGDPAAGGGGGGTFRKHMMTAGAAYGLIQHCR